MHGSGEYIWSDGLKYQVCKEFMEVNNLHEDLDWLGLDKSHNTPVF